MSLIPDHLKAQMIANAKRREADEDYDPFPVVKLFTPWAGGTWLLTELDPDDTDIAFGLCDLGLGFPELGSVRLSEIESLRGPLGLKAEIDQHFTADKSLSAYAYQAAQRGAIET